MTGMLGAYILSLRGLLGVLHPLVRTLSEWHARLLGALAKALAARGHFKDALQTALSISDEQEWTDAAATVLTQAAEQGQLIQVIQLAHESLDVRRANWLLCVAFKQAWRMGQWEVALQAAQGIADAHQRAKAVAVVVEALAERGEADKAWQLARQIEIAGERVWALCAVGEALQKAKRRREATNAFFEALRSARRVDQEHQRAAALSAIAKALAKAGQFKRALQVAQHIKLPDERAWTLNIIMEMTAPPQSERRVASLT